MKKRKKAITKSSKRRLVIFGSLSVIIMVYFFMTLSIYAIKIYNLKVEEKNLKQNLMTMQSNEKKLKIEIEKLKNQEYLAKYARENFQYSKDGELIFQLPDEIEKKDPEISKLNIDTNYILIGGSTIIGFIILYALKRHK